MSDAIGGLIVYVGLAALLFLVCRVIVLWYWRVGEAIDLLRGINEKLGRIAERPELTPQTPVPPARNRQEYSSDANGQFEKWLATRDPPLVNLSPGDRAYYRQSWESSHAHD
jgi:hypothetical protein